MSNLELWNSVCKTDPAHTKSANVRGNNITAIAPQYQIMLATEQFGPYGQTWGFKTVDIDYTLMSVGMITFKGLFYFPEGEFEILSSISIYRDNAQTKIDSDFGKKVETDALTKALSKLGFNADVFMGLYDDNKYVQDTAQEFKQKPRIDSMIEAYEANKKSVDYVKDSLANGEFESAAEAMAELNEEVRLALNVAPTKGGIWTLEETKAFQSPEYAAARTKYFEGKTK